MAKRKNTFTRFIEDIVDDTKDLVDDLIDRAKDVEENVKDGITDAVGDDENGKGDLEHLQASLVELTAKVNQLAELQLAGKKG